MIRGKACRGNSVADIRLAPASSDPDHYYRMRPQSTYTDEDVVSESESGVLEPTPDLAVEWFAPQNCFVGHGVFSDCQRCKSTIEADIMYYVCHKMWCLHGSPRYRTEYSWDREALGVWFAPY